MRKTVMAVLLIVALAAGATVFAAGTAPAPPTQSPPPDAGYDYNKSPARPIENSTVTEPGLHFENAPTFEMK